MLKDKVELVTGSSNDIRSADPKARSSAMDTSCTALKNSESEQDINSKAQSYQIRPSTKR